MKYTPSQTSPAKNVANGPDVRGRLILLDYVPLTLQERPQMLSSFPFVQNTRWRETQRGPCPRMRRKGQITVFCGHVIISVGRRPVSCFLAASPVVGTSLRRKPQSGPSRAWSLWELDKCEEPQGLKTVHVGPRIHTQRRTPHREALTAVGPSAPRSSSRDEPYPAPHFPSAELPVP